MPARLGEKPLSSGSGGATSQSHSSPLPTAVDELWKRRAALGPGDPEARSVVVSAVDMLDSGRARVAAVSGDGEVVVDERALKAVTLAFHVLGMARCQVGDFHHNDRIPLKTSLDGVRVVPGAIARWGAHLAPGVVLMPSFVDIGAHVGAGTTVGTWASVGSCAQVGDDVRLSCGTVVGGGGGAVGGLGGLEGLEGDGAAPAIVEDGALVGSRAVVGEGARVGRGAVLGAGTILSARTPVVDARTGEELGRGRVPDRCVAAGGTRSTRFEGGDFGLPCVLVVGRLREGPRHDRAELDEILREHGLEA
ncbi:2,3,4,5-tetrahydropyridine-2,6-dicarboxylate N-succinyltransferase [Streptosporangium carneum]|uniref:2,3,4,5-tetrahydropyridine-2,6-dicarboxylate N-succinyltransferase n=1 Tax=Streptosporangium carneum TaxID=47481 RepID=A0A9W6I469_9ACTN|nr:2,3,4,5-tetrahydropyridine-2,6-dicarboxylate N-succinyltransferase [Streptosporangium carneum]GLK11762.1 2,3,4,5-tetrahydropyridine-2,6-dicarboxylate N-succinyltransferase [Streptosporangium carneum]